MTCRLLIRLPILLLSLAMPMAGCAGNDTPSNGSGSSTGTTSARASTEPLPPDCDGLSSLADKRACYGKQSQTLIDECERFRPMRCKPYRDMASAERRLSDLEVASLAAARKTYATYVDGDAAYLTDLDAAAKQASDAWRAYREAQCSLEPFAQGMSRNDSEDQIEACRARMTEARIIELKALFAPANANGTQP